MLNDTSSRRDFIKKAAAGAAGARADGERAAGVRRAAPRAFCSLQSRGRGAYNRARGGMTSW